jgi:hypothetical protein
MKITVPSVARRLPPVLAAEKTGFGGTPHPQNPLTDLAAFPVLTEEVGFPPSPLARSGSITPSAPGVSGTGGLGQAAANAIADVLGWKTKPNDPKAFLGALTQSFELTEFEGHIESKWIQRSYATQTDLSGGISGAQASLYTRARFALDESLPLLDGLTPLDPNVDLEEAEAARQVVRAQMTELVNEFAFLSGPRISRVNQYFLLLLGQILPVPPITSPPTIETDPDKITGNLGNLRSVFGLATIVYPTGSLVGSVSDLINTIQDEQNVTNFRVLSDYLTSLAQSWVSNYQFFVLGGNQPFFGTQLVLISRQLQVVAEMVDELRFVLDSVFLGPAERQTIQLNFDPLVTPNTPPIFLEDLLVWIQNLATVEGPNMIQGSGKFGVAQVVQIATAQNTMIIGMATPGGLTGPLPPAFAAPRVKIAIINLQTQLTQLISVTQPAQLTTLPTGPFPLTQ